MRVRGALLWATASKYIIVIANLLTMTIVARLVTPTEYGISVLGMAVFGIAEAFRELGGGAYLIQHKALQSAQIRATFTLSLITTLIVSVLVVMFARPLSVYCGKPELANYLLVGAAWFAMGPFVYPVLALLTRAMAFRKLAAINVTTSLVNSVATIAFALAGFGYMSFAWAAVTSSAVGMLVGFYAWSDFSIFRPLLRGSREILMFSAYDSLAAVLFRLWEIGPYFILAKALNIEAVGIFQRAYSLSQFPERVIMAGVGAVALPAFSSEIRQGRSLKESYLSAIEHITGLQWPALITLALLAHPAVAMVLGSQWLGTVPLVEIICVALLFYFPIGLNNPLLIAVGGIRLLPALVLVQLIISLGGLALAAPFGLREAALSAIVTVPLNVLLSVMVVRRYVRFAWRDLWLAMRRSMAVAAISSAGPLLIKTVCGWSLDLSIGMAVVAGALAISGWLGGIWATGHPLWAELQHARSKVLKNFYQRRDSGARVQPPADLEAL
jgi:O-antigen/teichoic acid export membrane protein